ncbi:MAG: class I SAM-dependent methyltransferase [Candidatus Paceibacterota bacterium]
MESILKIISKSLSGDNKKTVLELGCGNGNLINAVAREFPNLEKIVAIDFYNEPKNLSSKVKFVKQDIENLNLDQTFDFVIINHVFEHIKNPLGLIERIKKILNKNGRILIVVPNRKGFNNEARVYLPEHGKHYFLWDQESLQFSLERLGFTCRFHNLYGAGSHNLLLKYIPILLRIQNPNLTCVAMLENN